jgi:hypothetical protein
MNRRVFLSGSIAAALHQVLRGQQCAPIPPGVIGCRAKIDFPNVVLASTLQQCPQWCWAASISMVFKFFQHPLDQKKIVLRKYGQVVCMPARTAEQIAEDLNDEWVDDRGKPFTSTLTAAYDFQAGVLAINNAIIINELINQRPLLYCNTHHAMVICAADYRPSPAGPLIDAVAVMDPWPWAPRIHPLSRPELLPAHTGGQMTFLASVRITDG